MQSIEILDRLKVACGVGSDLSLANRLNIPQGTIAKWRKRGRIPPGGIARIAVAIGRSVEWVVTGEEAGQKTRGAMIVSESYAPYGAEPDLTREEKELARMLLAILRGRNRENVQAIKSNLKAFYKSREMDSEPMLPTQRKAAG